MAEKRQWDIPDDLSTVSDQCVLDVILPTGAMGNVTAAYMTKLMGLPLGQLYNAVNANDIMDRVIQTGDFGKSSTMVRTLSEAINIQVPYNFERILYYITNGDATYVRSFYEDQPEDARMLTPTVHDALRATLASVRISDDEMKAALRHVYETTDQQYVCDPHTAVALAGVYKLQLLQQPSPQGRRRRSLVVMATASPCKFQAAVTAAIGADAWNTYAASEPALWNLLDRVEVPPLRYHKVDGGTLEETQAHWQSLLADVLQRLEAKQEE
jgi:threonine synthase